MPIIRRVRRRVIGPEEVLDALNEEIVPVLGRVRETANRDLVAMDVATVGGVLQIPWDTRHYRLSLEEDVADVTFTDPADVGWYHLVVTQSGAFTVSGWPPSVLWFGASAPTITATVDRVDLLSFYFDGASYLGRALQNAG